MRRWPVVAVTILTAVSLLGAGSPAYADDPAPPPPPPPTPAQEAFRAQVQTMLGGLDGLVSTVKANPALAAAMATGTDPAASVTAAEQQVSQLTSTQLDQLQQGLSQDPSWNQIPAQLLIAVQAFQKKTPTAPASAPASRLAARTSAPAAARAPGAPSLASKLPAARQLRSTAAAAGTFTGDCSTAGSAPDEFTATLVANQVQSAAQAAMLGVPGVVALFFFDVPTGVKIVLAAVWGVANAVYLALAQTLAVATDCAATNFTSTQTSTLPRDPTTPSVVVPGSSQISINTLIQAASDTSTEINNVKKTVDTINGQANTLVTVTANLDATLADINDRASEVQADLKLLKTNIDILKNTETTILNKANTEIANLNTFQTLQLRMEIEANLSRNGAGTGAVGWYELPSKLGGYLEVAGSIVEDTIAKETATGHGSSLAAGDLAAAKTAYTSGQWKAAYRAYCKAYQDVTK